MERFLLGGLMTAGIAAGVCMVVWPAWAALKSREDNERRLPTVREIWFMRVVGVAVVLGSGYGLYAVLTRMPGAEGPPLP
jgi:hypothetical protein